MNDLAQIQNLIYVIRGQRVMLDSDLAQLYEVETKVLNQAVKRNITRFPDNFMFQLSKNEWLNLRSQIVTFSGDIRKYTPYAFTEQGVAMLSSVLRSEKAIQVNIQIMNTFVKMRECLGLLAVQPFTLVSFFLRKICHSLQRFHSDELHFVPL
jgi:phage regulator Rha-like protein